MNDDKKGARSAPQTKRSAIFCKRLKRPDGPTRRRAAKAPIKASEELLINQQAIMVKGTPLLSWMIRCAGRAANIRNGQFFVGVNSKAPRRIEFGGHITETGCGWKVRAKPTL